MFRVEKMKPEYFSFAVKLANTMNWSMTEADFAFNRRMEPNGCFVLSDESKALGVATCISYGKIGWFGNLIIAQENRQHGAGTFLLSHALNYLKNSGVATVGLYAYPHLVDFYGTAGFKRDTEFVVLKAKEILPNGPIESEGKTKNVTQKNLSKIVECDAKCFGDSREKLLKAILSGENNICCAYEEEQTTVGYAASKVYEGIAEIGPIGCPDNRVEVGNELLETVFCRLAGSEGYMYLPSKETALLNMADRFGFKKEFSLVRMFLGPPVQTDCIYAAESLERG